MKAELAKRLLSDQMQWADDEAASEFARLELMINYKYDRYHGFEPGSRFYVALLGWLGQFSSVEDRRVAYRFFKEELVFISQREMHHLVNFLMPMVERHLHGVIANELGIHLYQTWLDATALESVRVLRRRTLFVGLSDGARMDVFRRYNEDIISNEQVVAATEMSLDKWRELEKDLRKALVKWSVPNGDAAQFKQFCLIDDFTGSGSSLIRWDDNEKKWKGKIPRFCNNYKQFLGESDGNKIPVQIHHYLASANAATQIEQRLQEFGPTAPMFRFFATFSYKLPPEIVVTDESDADLVALIKHCYDPKIEDDHTGPDIGLGYRQSGLPLVLDHNTPNNSVALLWARSPVDSTAQHKMRPLFARRKRHSSHG